MSETSGNNKQRKPSDEEALWNEMWQTLGPGLDPRVVDGWKWGQSGVRGQGEEPKRYPNTQATIPNEVHRPGMLQTRNGPSQSSAELKTALTGGTGTENGRKRAEFALREWRENPGKWDKYVFGPGKCNEFVYYVHMNSESGAESFPTNLRQPALDDKIRAYLRSGSTKGAIGYYRPNISDLADPKYAPGQLEYILPEDGSLDSVRSLAKPGDTLVWYDSGKNIHHAGIYVGNNEVVQASANGLKKSTLEYMQGRLEKVTPIIRRWKE